MTIVKMMLTAALAGWITSHTVTATFKQRWNDFPVRHNEAACSWVMRCVLT